MKPAATIVFTTYNRQDILRQAIQAAQKQTVPIDIIVMDDASTDGTATMMATEFPNIKYYRSSENKGPCYQRNRGIELAKTEIVFPLDDDSILQSPHTPENAIDRQEYVRNNFDWKNLAPAYLKMFQDALKISTSESN